MAKKGLSYPKYNVLDETDSLSVGSALAEAIKADVKININDVKMYADNTVSESIKEFKDGAITLEIDDIETKIIADILGHKVTIDSEMTANADDISPFIRLGFIVTRLKKKKLHYRVIVLPKVQFGIPDESFETSGESTVLKSTTIVGNIFRDKNNDWKIEKTFTALDEAIEYLDQMLNVNSNLTVTSVAGTASGKTAISVLPAKASANTYKYKIGADVKAPAIGSVVDDTFTAWDGIVEITAATGQEICIVEVNSTAYAVKTGKVTVVSKG